jgi:hypothetical protein
MGALKHPAWDCLSDTSPEGWMEFFKSLRCNAMSFGIVQTPFEAFDMVYRDKGHGPCLCSLGICHYQAMGWALFSILQQLLRLSDTYIQSQLESVANDLCNGFELLWMLQKCYIIIFDLTKEPTWPDWHSNIFCYANRVLMHCNLSHHWKTRYSDAQRSLLFLWGLQGRFKEITVAYVSMVLTHQQIQGNSAPLPHHLHILPLTQRLSNFNHGGVLNKVGMATWALRISTDTSPPSPPGDTSSIHIQGYMVYTAMHTASPLQGNKGPSSRLPPQAPPKMALSERHRNAAKCRAWYQSTCDAYGQWGHQASTCDKVGVWAFFCCFHKDRMNTYLIEEAKKAWIEKKAFLGDGTDTPKKVFTTYCNRLGIDEDQKIDEVD